MEGMELIVVEKLNPAKVFFDGGMDEILSTIRSKLNEFEGDATTDAGRKEIISMAYKVSRSKTLLDNIRKELISDAKTKIDKANATWKPAKETLDKWRDEVRQPVTEWEEAEAHKERLRIDCIQGELSELKGVLIDPFNQKTDSLKRIISELEALEISPERFYEFTSEAKQIKNEKLCLAREALQTRERLDKEEVERKEAAEMLAAMLNMTKAQEEQIAKLKAEREKIEAEKQKLADEKAAMERAEFEYKAREQAKAIAESEARKKVEREAEEKAQAEKKAKEEVERQEKMKPDREKLIAFSQFLMQGISYPETKSSDATEITMNAKKQIDELAVWVFEQAHSL